jgi:hypothetical protein
MHACKRWFCCLAGTIALVSPVSAQKADLAPVAKWTPWVEFGGFYGSNDSSRGEAVLWVPLAQGTTSLLFGEMRGKLFEDDMREGNFALGYRQMQANGWNIGVWGGYDVRRSEFGNTFHQIAGGFEALSDRWDVRANAYLPLDDSETLFSASTFTSATALEFTGTSIGLITSGIVSTTALEELALRGFDAEIGAKIFSTSLDLTGPHHEFRLYAGAFHFDHSDLPNSATGPRVRAEWRMDDVIDQWAGSRLTLEAEYSHDQLRDDRFEVGARLRLPFGDTGTRLVSRSLSAQERRMAEGLERDTDIVTGTATVTSETLTRSSEAVEDAKTGVRFDRVAMADGTNDIATASAAAGANSLIVATGNIGGPQSIAADQTLQGGGSTIQVRGAVSGVVVDFTAPGARPTLTNTLNNPILTIGGSNTHISGVDIVGSSTPQTSNDGISVRNAINVHIDDANIDNVASGIYLTRYTSAAISNSLITSRLLGIYGVAENTFTVSNTNIDAGGTGIRVGDRSVATISDTEVRSEANGLYVDDISTAHVSRMVIDGGNLGIFLFGANTTLNLNDSVLKGTFGSTGVRANGTNITFSGTGNTVEAGTTFGDRFCEITGTVTGTLGFNTDNCP